MADNCSTGTAGAAVEMIVAARLMLDGWTVFTAPSPNGPVDVIAFKPNESTRYIEVRAGYYYGDNLSYPKHVHKGHPTPTEFAVYVHSTGQLIFVPVAATL